MRNLAIRKAILIGAPGGQGSNFLPGVQKDLRDFKTFLCSIHGGLWREDEIQTLYNPSAQDAVLRIQSTQAEYVLVYFSGHGYTDVATGSRMLCFKHHATVPDIALTQARSPRLLMFSDACRNFHGEGISRIPILGPDYFNFTRETSQIRQLFDEAILNSPHGRIIVHGTAQSQFAMDSRNGGYFTQALLHVAGRMNNPIGNELVRIEQVFYHVTSVLEERENDQMPEIIYLSGELTVPFAVAMPIYETASTPTTSLTQMVETTSSSGNGPGILFGLSLIAIALYLSG